LAKTKRIEDYALIGDRETAALGCTRRHDVGLLTEEFGSTPGCMLGNFPQAFSHVLGRQRQAMRAGGGAHPP
jgi:GH15 family glucan-1,4-alpha-glucosidase